METMIIKPLTLLNFIFCVYSHVDANKKKKYNSKMMNKAEGTS